MTRDQVKKMLPAMIAYAEGKDIQVRGGFLNTWEDVLNPSFKPTYEYREKPFVSEVWGFTDNNGLSYFFTLKENAEEESAAQASMDNQLGKYTVHHFHMTD